MSKKINVNPDHYKLAGRERPGHVAARPPRALAGDDAARRWTERQNKKEKIRSEK